MTDSYHVLAVDDQEFNLQLIRDNLDRSDIISTVSTARSGTEALQRVLEDPPDLVILDVMLPGMDGFEMCRRLKSDPVTVDIPVIMLTSLTDVRSRIQGIEAGADDFISRPFNSEELLARVHSLLKLRDARRQLRTERDRLNAIISNSDDAILFSDPRGRPSLLNAAAERLLDVRGRDIYGHLWRDFVADEALLSFLERAIRSDQRQAMEINDAQGQTFDASVTPLVGVGTVIVLRDITESKELEQMRLATEQAEKQHLRETLERYMGVELVARILHQERGLLERRERLEVVVLFADLRGFTHVTSYLSPGIVVNILNAFFTEMSQLVYSANGTIFDLIGDELMVGYGVPFPQADAADRALQIAVAMQRRFAGLSQHWHQHYEVVLGLGVGINRGPVIVGNVGSPRRMHYTMIGDAVNVAHRLVELAGPGEIILSQAVLEGLCDPIHGLPMEELPPTSIKGKQGAHVLYRVLI